MKVLVVGPGAMGTLFAGMLALGGHDVWLLGRRPDMVAAIAQEGVTLVRGERKQRVMVRAAERAEDAGPSDLVIIFVKAYDTLRAAKDAMPAVGSSTVVLTLQNGLNNVETIASVVGRERVMAGVTAHGATLLGRGVVLHAGMGETTIGELDGRRTQRLRTIAAAFRQAGIEVNLCKALNSLIWGKLVVNASINPLTALLSVRNGELLARADARELMAAVALEVANVAQQMDIRLPYPHPIERVEAVCRLTASNRSSMLQDVDRGVLTEIDYINGAIVREGEARGIPVPINSTLTRLVRALTRGGSEAVARPAENPGRRRMDS